MVVLTHIEKPFTAREVMRLYEDAGWWKEREEVDIEIMLQKEISVGAWKDEVLVGFARAVTDGKFRAYVEDVVIHSSIKRKGIGTLLVTKLREELSHIEIISLFCDEELIPFYEKNQFKQSKSQFVMHRKNV